MYRLKTFTCAMALVMSLFYQDSCAASVCTDGTICQNDGTCRATGNDRTISCVCKPGWTGSDCSQAVVCFGHTRTISCAAGYYIHIDSAFYGSVSSCNNGVGTQPSETCSPTEVTAEFVQLCIGKQSCSITNNHGEHNNDHCNHLTVQYSCDTLLYSFGFGAGDTRATPSNCNDGSTGTIAGASGFPFYGQTRSDLRINVNGIISFGIDIFNWTPYGFPSNKNGIAIYQSDVQDVCGPYNVVGDLFYRVTNDPVLLSQAVSDLQGGFASTSSFVPQWLLIVTWNNVTVYPGSHPQLLNTFQAVLTTDGHASFVIFNYGHLSWTTGSDSGGNALGLGGIPAMAGFDAGDGVNYYTLPGAMTSAVLDLSQSTNCYLDGRWMFRVDGATIAMPSTPAPGR